MSSKERRWWESLTRGERIGVVAGGVLTLWFVFQVSYEAAGGGNAVDMELSPLEVIVDCERAVESQLLAPTTAEFLGTTNDARERVYQSGAARYRYSGQVESQNAFGVPLRSSFSCQLVYEDGGWRASVNIDSPI